MPRKIQPKEYKGWPKEIRPHYIRLFSLQERLRAHLIMAQELAKRNYYLKYSTSPRKTGQFKISGRPDDYLRRYREEKWPEIREYLKYVCEEIDKIKASYKGGRYPKWYESILMVETLAEQILEKMEMIQVQLIVTLRSGSEGLKESNEVIIKETAKVLIMAYDLREVLTFVPLDQSKIGKDEYGIEAIIDLSPKEEAPQEQLTIDFTQMEAWQQKQRKTTTKRR